MLRRQKKLAQREEDMEGYCEDYRNKRLINMACTAYHEKE